MEVEAAYIERGDLVPDVHRSYWMGLYASVLKPPQFMWNDVLSGALNWTHWGTYTSEQGTFGEPNNLQGQENCGAANASQAYDSAFGWMDANCNIKMPFLCRLNSGWLTARGLARQRPLRPAGYCTCMDAPSHVHRAVPQCRASQAVRHGVTLSGPPALQGRTGPSPRSCPTPPATSSS